MRGLGVCDPFTLAMPRAGAVGPLHAGPHGGQGRRGVGVGSGEEAEKGGTAAGAAAAGSCQAGVGAH